jgi:2-methylisocitrate lyase-like PEP mutase family enzyme
VTVDFEGGYSDDDAVLAANVSRLLDLGIVGINFEDRVVHGEGLYPASRQARRIAAVRDTAQRKGIDLFINARTDLFLSGEGDPRAFIDDALGRAKAYTDAGASGFFVPGLTDDALIKQICDGVSLPVNLMVMEGLSPARRLSELGVARISYGSIPYIEAMNALKQLARDAIA